MSERDEPLAGDAIKALFAEWTRDSAAAKVRDSEGENSKALAAILESPPSPAPPPGTGKERER